MKLLAAAKAEVLTGDVFCGRHRAVEDDDEWFSYKFGDNVCVLPANHEGDCQHENLPGLMRDKKIRVESKEDLYREMYGGARTDSRSTRRPGQSMYDYLDALGYAAYGKYDWNLRREEYVTGQAYDQARQNLHVDYAVGKDSTVYSVEHPDTHDMLDISKEDFMTIYKASTIGPAHFDTAKYAKIAREVLKKYV